MSHSQRIFRVTFAAVCLLGTVGCVPNRRWQAATPSTPALAPGKGLPVAVIEFDGMGELWDRCDLSAPSTSTPCQLRDALDYIRDQRRQAESKADVIVVTYVHGWHHNARSDDHDYENFSQILHTLQTKATTQFANCKPDLAARLGDICPPRPTKYVGAYIAWRGEVIGTFLNEATAFDREKAAQRTALVSMSEVIVRLRNAAKQTSEDNADQPPTAARFLLFGHSYGGMIVERIMAQMLTAALLPEHRATTHPCGAQGDGQRPFADLIFLINPAGDAIETEQLIDLMKRSKVRVCPPPHSNPNFDPPLIVAIHARNDFWTGKGFAIGHTLESTDKVFRGEQSCDFCDGGIPDAHSQKFLYKHTVASIQYFHNYCYISNEPMEDPVCARIRAQVNPAPGFAGNAAAAERAFPHSTVNSFDPALTDHLYRRIDPLPPHAGTPTHPWNDTPYWLFTLPKNIVDQHSGFWTPRFTSFVGAIVEATTAPGGTAITMR